MGFAACGLPGTPVDSIAARVRCSRGLTDTYFGGKEGLFDAGLADISAATLEWFRSMSGTSRHTRYGCTTPLRPIPMSTAVCEAVAALTDTGSTRPWGSAFLDRVLGLSVAERPVLWRDLDEVDHDIRAPNPDAVF